MPRLARNTLFNLLGFGLPLLVAVVAIPALTERAGLARFGFLTIVWALVGYAGFLDLGLSRVFARRIAAARVAGEAALAREAAALGRASRLALLACTAIAALLAVAVPVQWLVGEVAAQELRLAWLALLLALPALVVSSLQRGAMEGMEAFGAVNVLRVGMGFWMFAGPLLVLVVTPLLPWLVLALTAGRWVSLALHWGWCRRLLPAPTAGRVPLDLRESLREGFWITVSNVIGPLMVVFDRVALAALAGLASVSAYAIAQEVALRLLLVPGALALALFPRLAALGASGAGQHVSRLSDTTFRWVTAAMLALCVVGLHASGPVLAAWLMWPLHWETQLLLAVMLLGVMANGGAQIAFSLLQATSHARATALLHLVELPLYVAALVWTVPRYGLMGAAWVWTLRTVVDAAFMIWLARSVLPQSVSVRAAAGWLAAVASMTMFLLNMFLYPVDMGWAELMIYPLVVISFMLMLVPWHELRRRYVR